MIAFTGKAAFTRNGRAGFPSPVDCELVKLRLPGRRAESPDAATPVLSAAQAEELERVSGKGRPTPKRTEAQGRRAGPPPPPPTTRKEAYRRMRANQAVGRSASRQAAARGDEAYLPARDRGPVRKLARDLVDSRRNVGSFFLVIAAVALIGTIAPSVAIRGYATVLLLGFFLVFAVDSVVLARKVKKTVAARFADAPTRGLVMYSISRSTMIRRWRFPKPTVSLGADV
jgi:hypothetical protein